MNNFKLLFDTSTERAIIALFSDQRLIGKKELAVGLSNSRSLLPALDVLFKEAGIEPNLLQYVAVGHGPGSYTGIRVGVACAKALAFGLNIPLIGISGLRGFAPEIGVHGPFFSVIDAKIGGVYRIKAEWQKQGQNKGQNETLHFLTQEQLVPFDAFVEELKQVSCLVTPSQQALEVRLKGYELDKWPIIYEKAASVELLLQEAEAHYAAGRYSLDGALSLLYLR